MRCFVCKSACFVIDQKNIFFFIIAKKNKTAIKKNFKPLPNEREKKMFLIIDGRISVEFLNYPSKEQYPLDIISRCHKEEEEGKEASRLN